MLVAEAAVEAPPEVEPKKQKKKKKSEAALRKGAPAPPPWDVNASVWAPRKVWSDSKDVLDSVEVERKRISNDWRRACAMGVDSLIGKYHTADEDGNGVLDELEDCEALLHEVRGFIFVLFQYYTCVGGLDICFMSLNQWSLFAIECGIADNRSKNLKTSDLDRLFIAIDTKAAMTQQHIQNNFDHKTAKNAHHDDLKKKVLHRVEFLVGLVHIAVLRYVATGLVPDVSDALYKLLIEDIMPTLNPRILTPSPNAFRSKMCYRQEVDVAFKRYEPALRNIFTAMCTTGGRGEKERHMALIEWVLLCRGADLTGPDCSDRDAIMCFAWSRMCVIDELTIQGRMRDSHLPFEGFLEALVRISLLKVLPTDQEIEDYGARDAGMFYKMLRHNDEEQYQKLIRDVERNPQWGERPRQPVHRCVSHVCAIMTNQISEWCGNTSANGEVSETEATRWARKMAASRG